MTTLHQFLTALLLVAAVHSATVVDKQPILSFDDEDSMEVNTELYKPDWEKEVVYTTDAPEMMIQEQEKPAVVVAAAPEEDISVTNPELFGALVAGVYASSVGYYPSQKDLQVVADIAQKQTPISELTADQMGVIGAILGAMNSGNVQASHVPSSDDVKLTFNSQPAAAPVAPVAPVAYQPAAYQGFYPSNDPSAYYHQAPRPYAAMYADYLGAYYQGAYPRYPSYPVYQKSPYPSYSPSSYPASYPYHPFYPSGSPYGYKQQMPQSFRQQYAAPHYPYYPSYPSYPSYPGSSYPAYPKYQKSPVQSSQAKFAVKTPSGDVLILDPVTQKATKLILKSRPDDSHVLVQSRSGEPHLLNKQTGVVTKVSLGVE